MLIKLLLLLDTLGIAATLVAAWLWYKASRGQMRRVSQHETIDQSDLNRIVVSFNRTQILNRRAALATAVSAAIIAIRLAATWLYL
jgi:hypothetical protein